jgi:hypothetical protein
MPLHRSGPPLEYLETASDTSLESFELSRLNHAANLRREITALMDRWLEETAGALVARALLERRRLIRASQGAGPKSLDNRRSHTALLA